MPKGRPIFIKRVPWHTMPVATDEHIAEVKRQALHQAGAKCCKQGCSRCMRKPT